MLLRSAWSPPPVDTLPLAALAAGAAGVALLIQIATPAPVDAITTLRTRVERSEPRRFPTPFVELDPAISARQPFGLTSSAQTPKATSSGGFTLIGLADAAGHASAVVRDASGATHSLQARQAIGPWRLIGVVDGRAVLAGPSGPLTLEVGASTAPALTTPSAQSVSTW